MLSQLDCMHVLFQEYNAQPTWLNVKLHLDIFLSVSSNSAQDFVALAEGKTRLKTQVLVLCYTCDPYVQDFFVHYFTTHHT